MGTRLRGARGWSSRIAAALPLLVVIASAGCGYRLQMGLVNYPGVNRPQLPELADGPPHDIIANGDESCPRAGSAEKDPLWFRWPPCGVTTPPPKRRAAPKAPPHRLGPLEPLDDSLQDR